MTNDRSPGQVRNESPTAAVVTAPAAPDRRPPGFVASSLRIFDLSISEMLWSRRTIFMALVVAAPVSANTENATRATTMTAAAIATMATVEAATTTRQF